MGQLYEMFGAVLTSVATEKRSAREIEKYNLRILPWRMHWLGFYSIQAFSDRCTVHKGIAK